MAKNQSLADKLAALTNPTPEFDNNQDEEEDEVTGAKVTEADDDDDLISGERSYLRTVNAPNLDDDTRYKGKRINRKDFQKDRDFMEHSTAELGHMFDVGGDDDEEGDEDDDNEDADGENEGEEEGGSENEIEDDDLEGGHEMEMFDDQESDGKDDEDDNDMEEDSEDGDDGDDNDFDVDISSFANKADAGSETKSEETMFKINEGDALYLKSQAVIGQLSCWDKLLEQRILIQKMLTNVNTFPREPENFVDQDDDEHVKLVNKANKALSSLLLKTVQLKNSIEKRGLEDSKTMKRKLEDMSDWLEEDFDQGDARRRERIGMWSDRTQKLGNMASMNTPTLEQIDQIVSNMPRLVKRTKIARVECNVLGEKEADTEGQQENDNIFDDSDFYHHMLRELIEKKTSSPSESGEVGKHWLQIQKLRSKLKKKVDTRASKGRKVRYDIHTKLVNFMAPVRLNDQITDSARQELFSSLFGARKT